MHKARIGLSLVAVVAGAGTDCFGVRSTTDALSVDVWNRLFAPFYEQTGQEHVSVVLLDDAFLARAERAWPLPYADHAEVLNRIARFEPRAIFVDFLFAYGHARDETLPVLAATIRDLREDGLDVYVAAPSPCLPPTTYRTRSMDELRPGLGLLPEVAGAGEPVVVEWEGTGGLYPLETAPHSLARASPRAERCMAAEADAPWPSAALALFGSLCEGRDAPLGCAGRESGSRERAVADPMLIYWGAGPSALQREGMPRDRCVGVRESLGRRGGWIASVLLRELLRSVAYSEPHYAGCPYTDTITFSELFPVDPEDGSYLPPEPERLSAFFRDRVVLVGDGLAHSGDKALSPVHGQVPGVFLHAMALDNLISWRGGYYRQSSGLVSPEAALEIALSLLVLVLAVYLRERLAEPDCRKDSLLRPLGWSALFVLGALVAIAGLVVLLAFALHRSPANWVGVFSLFLITLPWCLSDTAKRWWEGERGGRTVLLVLVERWILRYRPRGAPLDGRPREGE